MSGTASELSDPRLRALCTLFLERHGPRLRRTAGARDYHHARRGGLVEHVAQMTRSALQVCAAYPLLNRDLLVAGVLFHDVGKLWENAYQENGFAMPYTEMSELLGHIPLAWRWSTSSGASSSSHRRTPRGRISSPRRNASASTSSTSSSRTTANSSSVPPVVPKTPEAQALHYIDNLDAKMEMFERGYQTAPELGRHVYDRVRPLPGRLVAPLPKFESLPIEIAEEPLRETGEDESA